MAQNSKAKNKKILTVVGLVLALFIIIGIAGGGDTPQQNNRSDTSQQQDINDKKDTAVAETQDTLMDAMRKCTVGEAYDIQITGVGHKTDNVFNDGRKYCETSLNRDYDGNEAEFTKDVNTDWNDKKDEMIEGKPLSHYLDILGW